VRRTNSASPATGHLIHAPPAKRAMAIGRPKGRGRAVSRYLRMSPEASFANRRNARGRIKYFVIVCKSRVNGRIGSTPSRADSQRDPGGRVPCRTAAQCRT
jgi:hypothetical protein